MYIYIYVYSIYIYVYTYTYIYMVFNVAAATPLMAAADVPDPNAAQTARIRWACAQMGMSRKRGAFGDPKFQVLVGHLTGAAGDGAALDTGYARQVAGIIKDAKAAEANPNIPLGAKFDNRQRRSTPCMTWCWWAISVFSRWWCRASTHCIIGCLHDKK